MHKKITASRMSIRALMATYNSFAATLWNVSASPLFKSGESPSTTKRLLAGCGRGGVSSDVHAGFLNSLDNVVFHFYFGCPVTVLLDVNSEENVLISSCDRHLVKLCFNEFDDPCH